MALCPFLNKIFDNLSSIIQHILARIIMGAKLNIFFKKKNNFHTIFLFKKILKKRKKAGSKKLLPAFSLTNYHKQK
jgi:hypothetical protein